MTDDVMIPGVPVVRIADDELPDSAHARVESVTVDLSMHRTSSAVVVLYDDSLELLDAPDLSSVVVGAKLTVAASSGSASTPTVFTGAITGVRVSMDADVAGGTPFVEITAHSGGHRLRRHVGPDSSTEESVTRIVERVAQHAGLEATVTGPGLTRATPAHLLPTGSCEQLLDQLALLHGADWWTDGDTLHFAERVTQAASLRLDRADDMLGFEIGVDGRDVPETVTVRGSDEEQQDVVGVSPGDRKALQLPAPQAVGSTAAYVRDSVDAAAEAFGIAAAGRTTVSVQDEAAGSAGNLHGRMLRDALDVRVTTGGTPAASVGDWVELAGLGERLSGDYLLTDVRHVFDGAYTTELRCQPPPVPAAAAGEPVPTLLRGLSTWSTNGPVRGIVTKIHDERNASANHGRVEVRFPSLGENMVSTWARVAAPGAGPSRGLDMRPETGDEVLVAFEGGDPSRAVVLGGLWSAGRVHPHGTTSSGRALDQSQVLRGHNGGELVFHGADSRQDEWTEGSGAAHASLSRGDLEDGLSLAAGTNGGAGFLALAKEQVVLDGVANPVTVRNGKGSLVIDEDGNLTIECASLTIKAKQKAELKAQQDLTLQSGSKATVKGTSGLEVEAPKVTVKGLGGVDVKTTKMSVGP